MELHRFAPGPFDKENLQFAHWFRLERPAGIYYTKPVLKKRRGGTKRAAPVEETWMKER